MKTHTLIGLCTTVLMAAPAAAQDTGRAIEIMREVAERCPRAYAHAHRDENQHPEAWDFVILATQALKRFDAAIGMNGKRGNANDPSSDALAYVSPGGLRIVDFLVGAGEHGTDPGRITWHDVTRESTVDGVVMGVYIDPDSRQPLVPCGSEPGPPPASSWETKHSDVLTRFEQRFPRTGDGRAWLRQLAEQFAASFAGEGWGVKSADPSRPQSADVIARQANGRLVGYRVVPRPPAAPAEIALTGQHFIAVDAVNHLGDSAPPPPPPPPDGVMEAIAQLRARLEELHVKVDALGSNSFDTQQRVQELDDRVSAQLQTILSDAHAAAQNTRELLAKPTSIEFPEYIGRVLSATVVLRPRR